MDSTVNIEFYGQFASKVLQVSELDRVNSKRFDKTPYQRSIW